MNTLHKIAFVLVILGGLHLGVLGMNYDLLRAALGKWPAIVQIVHILIGLSAVYLAVYHRKDCKVCESGS